VIADADVLVELITVAARRMLRVDGTVAPADAASALELIPSARACRSTRSMESGAESAAAKVGEVLAAAQRRDRERAAGEILVHEASETDWRCVNNAVSIVPTTS
jgi:hypothetical protein